MDKTNFCILLYLVFLASLCYSQDYKYDDYDDNNYDYNTCPPCTCPPNPPPLPCIPPPIPPPPMGKMIFFSILNMMKYRLTCSLFRGLNVIMDEKVIYRGSTSENKGRLNIHQIPFILRYLIKRHFNIVLSRIDFYKK